MRHARNQDLDRLEPLLVRLRAVQGMVEKKRGVFYRKSKSFLHFHEDPKGLFADIRTEDLSDFERIEVTGPEGRDHLLSLAAKRA